MSRHRSWLHVLDDSPVAVLTTAIAALRRHLMDHPAVAVSRVMRAAPRPLRRLGGSVAGRLRTTWGPLALAAAGQRESARTAIAELAATPRRRVGAAAAAFALHDGEAAQQVMSMTGSATPDDRYARALCLRTLGFLSQAALAVAEDDSRRARALRRHVDAERTVLAPTGRAARPVPAPRGGQDSPELSVLHLVTNALPETQAGYTTRTQGIVRALRAQGVDAKVAPRVGFPVTEGHLMARGTVSIDGVPYLRSFPVIPPTDVAAQVAADAAARGRLARSCGATVLHAHSNYLNARAALAERDRTGVPVVYEVRGMLEETWRSRGGDATADVYQLARASETEALLAADAVVVISEVLRREVVQRGVPASRVTVIPNAVDDRFLAEPPDAAPLRRELGLETHETVIGTVSTLNDYEGLEVLVDAVGLLRSRGLPVRLLVVGEGPARARLQERAATLGKPAAVFTGRVPFADVHRFHVAIDVFAVPRLELPVTALVPPLKPLEAMATGTPVVASDLAPMREIVQPGVTGELAPPGDAEALAHVLTPLVTETTLRLAMGSRARDWAHTERTWHRAAQQYRAIYHRLGIG